MNSPNSREVEFLSDAAEVSMGEDWFEIASLDHFWIRRRFEVLRALVPSLEDSGHQRMAEVGCGHGLLQSQFEKELGRDLDGFDLNVGALRQNLSSTSRVACYDIFQRREDLRGTYQGVFLFDVIEHIDEEDAFLDASLDLLDEGGQVFINVPSSMKLYSAYDEAVGHVRRYSPQMIQDLARRAGLVVESWTYWGLCLYPILLARNLRIRGASRDAIIRKGFAPPGDLANAILLQLSRLETSPQHLGGTSIMAVLRRQTV